LLRFIFSVPLEGTELIPESLRDIRFSCKRCSKCCQRLEIPLVISDFKLWVKEGRWDIVAKVRKKQAYGALRFMGLDFYFTFELNPDGSCVFLRSKRCSIYEVRPLACRLFPFIYNTEKGIDIHSWAVKNCPGLGSGKNLSVGEIKELSKLCHKMHKELMDLPMYQDLIEEILGFLRKKNTRTNLNIGSFH